MNESFKIFDINLLLLAVVSIFSWQLLAPKNSLLLLICCCFIRNCKIPKKYCAPFGESSEINHRLPIEKQYLGSED